MIYSQRIKRAYSRTPGQLLSLTTQFTFSPILENRPKPLINITENNKCKNDRICSNNNNNSNNLPFHFSSPNPNSNSNQNINLNTNPDTNLNTNKNDAIKSQLPMPFFECNIKENNLNLYNNQSVFDSSDSFDKSYHCHGDSSFKENTRLLDIVSTSSHHLNLSNLSNHIIHNLSDTLLKSSHAVETVDQCNSTASKKPRLNLNTTEIKTPFNTTTITNTTSGMIESGSTIIGDGQEPAGDSVWGTPDYLAPEILVRSGEGPEVDWWALGVCFYEFLCGFPPFNDDSVELIFKNIIDCDMVWPPIVDSAASEQEEQQKTMILLNEKFKSLPSTTTTINDDIPTISLNAANIIAKLLHSEPRDRADFDVIVGHAYFSGVNWNNIINSSAPFVPEKCGFTFLA